MAIFDKLCTIDGVIHNSEFLESSFWSLFFSTAPSLTCPKLKRIVTEVFLNQVLL